MISFSPAAAEHESTGWQSPPCMFLEPGSRRKVMRREDVICTDINCSPSFPSAAPAALCGRAACTGLFPDGVSMGPGVCVEELWKVAARNLHRHPLQSPEPSPPFASNCIWTWWIPHLGPFWGYFR